MADISRIRLADGEVYDIKDREVRRQIELLLGTKNDTQDEQKDEQPEE